MFCPFTKFVLLCGFSLLYFAPSYAQLNDDTYHQLVNDELSYSESNDILFVLRETVDLSSSLTFQNAVLIDYKDQAFKTAGRYRPESDEIEIKIDERVKTVYPQKVKAVKIGKMIFIPLEIPAAGNENTGYFQIISTGKKSLLKRYVSENGKTEKQFYILDEDKPRLLETKKKCILKELDDDKVRDFIKSNDTDVKREKDLLSVFDFYNNL